MFLKTYFQGNRPDQGEAQLPQLHSPHTQRRHQSPLWWCESADGIELLYTIIYPFESYITSFPLVCSGSRWGKCYPWWQVSWECLRDRWQLETVSSRLTSFRISHSRFRMQSSFLLRQRCAAMRFLLRRLTSWINSSCSEVSLCIFTNIWKSFRGRFVIWSTGKGSFTWNRKKKRGQM